MKTLFAVLMFIATAAMAQDNIPPGPPPANPPGVPAFRTEWMDNPYVNNSLAFVIGEEDIRRGYLFLKVTGNTPISTESGVSFKYIVSVHRDRQLIGSRILYASSTVKFYLDRDLEGNPVQLVPGERLRIEMMLYEHGEWWTELTFESGDTVRIDVFADPLEINVRRVQRSPFDPLHPGLVISRTPAAGTRERTGGGWGHAPTDGLPGSLSPPPFAKPAAVREMSWGELKNR